MFSLWLGLIVALGNLVYIFFSLSDNVSFWQLSSFAFIALGILAGSIIGYGFSNVLYTLGFLLNFMLGRKKTPSDNTFRKMSAQLVNIAKTSGKDRVAMVNALESLAGKNKDPVLRYAVDLISIGYDSEKLSVITRNRVDYYYFRDIKCSQVLADMGSSAPAFGMMGTVMGLIVVLSRIDDPSQLGQGLSVALITTLYGVLVSRAIFFPLSTLIKSTIARVRLYRYFIIEALQRLGNRESPVEIEDYLNSYFK